VVVVVEHLPRDLRRRDQCQLGDLGADLLERALRLGFDLALRLLEPPLPVGLGLVLDALTLRLGDTTGLGEDLLGLPACLSSSLRASLRVCSASSMDCRMRSRRSSMTRWIGPNA
jgi:hypothetical protein